MLVYIHVPFCRTRCNYCAFHSSALGRGVEPAASPAVRDYVDTLFLEIARKADRYAGEQVSSVFFGGGTPSLLPPRILGLIMERIARYFTLAPRAEITLEANPDSLQAAGTAADLLAAGINRLSLGVQSLDDRLLRMLGRPHRAADAIRAYNFAREAGFANVGVDLLWGLPEQGVRNWLEGLKEIVQLAPEHISAYNLTLEPGTALEEECRIGRLALPPERDQNIMFMEGSALLESAGYLHYEISNFARMGFQCRHNTGYWEGAPYLGLGPSATSTIGERRFTNPASQREWSSLVQEDTEPAAEILSPEVRLLELIMLRLRTSRGLRLKAYRDLTGRDFTQDHQRLIQALHENGLIRIREGYMRLTRSGMLVSNSILANIFEQTRSSLHRGDDALAKDAPGQTPAAGEQFVQPVVWPGA